MEFYSQVWLKFTNWNILFHFLNIQSEHKRTLNLQNYTESNAAHLELHTYTSR
jgi:hypothetical protein